MPELAPLTGIDTVEEEKVVPEGNREFEVSSTAFKTIEATKGKFKGEELPVLSLGLRYTEDDEGEYGPIFLSVFLPHDEMERAEVVRATRDLKRAAEAFGVDIDGNWDPSEGHADFKGAVAKLSVKHKASDDGRVFANVRLPRFAA